MIDENEVVGQQDIERFNVAAQHRRPQAFFALLNGGFIGCIECSGHLIISSPFIPYRPKPPEGVGSTANTHKG
ncbi:hypothetical protein NZA98_06535, partial [Escherichia coli]|nr:hypothetical protein [Escherichia coli]